MWFAPRIALLPLAFSLSLPALADLEVPRDAFEFDPHLTGQGARMNYGPFLANSLISADRKIIGTGKQTKSVIDPGLRRGQPETVILRAINVYLGGKYCAAFDTEMCGFAAAWSGGFVNIDGTNLNGYKGETLGHLRLPVIFQNAQTPGWSLNGDFSDPRRPAFGALPKNVAHYKGLYLHGWKTILSYTVAGVKVLDMPALLVKNKTEVLSRTLWIGPSTEPRWLFLCDLAGARGELAAGKALAHLMRQDTTLRAGVRGVPNGAELQIIDRDKIALKVPAHKDPLAFKVFLARDTAKTEFQAVLQESGPPEDLPTLCRGGPARWKETIALPGKLGPGDAAYTVDAIPLPDKNPWGSWMRPGAFDFFKDGRAALCTWNGDVWIVSGLDDTLAKVTWKRHATGLYEALGLRIVDDVIYVLGRDQITRLHDLDGNGEADFYENFNNDAPTAPTFHSFAMELHTDRAGNFYYSRGSHRVQEGTSMHGGVIKVARDGSRAELICTGFREANGMSVGPDDTITIADNQGNNVPTSKIDIVRPGGWYGFPWGLTRPYPEPVRPLCWIPYKEDNSSGGQAWVTSKKWGPFEGDLLHTSYGSGKLFKVFVQRDGDRFQGGVTAFPLQFDSGIMRARFQPLDGQLYVCGLKGWGSNAKTDGCFNRVRYTGKPVYMPRDLRIGNGHIDITFTQPLDKDSWKLPNVDVEQWTYVWWSDKYGSKEFSIINPGKVGHDPVKVDHVELSGDGKKLTLHIGELKPVMQMGIHLRNLRAADGTAMPTTIYNTINYVK